LTESSSETRVRVRQAETAHDVAGVRTLYREYADWIGVDLSYQGFAEELASLPGVYAPPRGRLLLAESGNAIAGCVALRPLDARVCEMKRLYVRPGFRGQGLAKGLVRRVLEEARAIRYTTLRLDTLPFMTEAMRLYEALGFHRCGAYYETPIQGTVFMELRL
jgi:putative acetyltransferase